MELNHQQTQDANKRLNFMKSGSALTGEISPLLESSSCGIACEQRWEERQYLRNLHYRLYKPRNSSIVFSITSQTYKIKINTSVDFLNTILNFSVQNASWSLTSRRRAKSPPSQVYESNLTTPKNFKLGPTCYLLWPVCTLKHVT